MPFHDLSLIEIVCDPETEEKLDQVEPWLFESGDVLYPVLCGTPVFQPNIDHFLLSESLSVARAFAEMEEETDIKSWFLSRYGTFNAPDPSPVDSNILGEGYPGFWDIVPLPDFLKDLKFQSPENMIMDIVGKHHYQIGLDLGSGQGNMTQLMADNCRQVLGLESNFYLAATANRLLKANEIPIRYLIPEKGYRISVLEKQPLTNAQVICGDVRMMPFNEPLFDWVHCGHLLDLMEDPARILVDIQKIMKPGATLSICTPWDFSNPGHFDGLLEILASDFTEVYHVDSIPWLRYNHKRKCLIHEDWIWVGKLKS